MNPTAHIIVDFQNDFVAENGSLSVKAEALGGKIRGLIDTCKQQTIKNIATKDWHPHDHTSFASSRGEEPLYIDGSWPKHCVQGSRGSDLHWTINHSVDEIIHKGMEKEIEEYSGFATGKLDQSLKTYGVSDLIISGVATDYCVGATALDAAKLGYNVTVVSDAIKAVDEKQGQEMIETMKSAGIQFKTSSEILETLKKIV